MEEEKNLTKEQIVENFEANLISNDELEGNDDDYSQNNDDKERRLVTDK